MLASCGVRRGLQKDAGLSNGFGVLQVVAVTEVEALELARSFLTAIDPWRSLAEGSNRPLAAARFWQLPTPCCPA